MVSDNDYEEAMDDLDDVQRELTELRALNAELAGALATMVFLHGPRNREEILAENVAKDLIERAATAKSQPAPNAGKGWS